VIFPYSGDWSYSDYDGAPTDAYPPPAAEALRTCQC
jgi:hypothetical protein